MKLVHISDLHIRSSTRHDEYRQVFEQVYKKLREEHVDYIVLAGDIAHTKTQEAPEFYDFAAEFLVNLAKIAPTHILLGNHDGNLLNTKRLDVISPIVSMLNNPNIFLHKKSERVDLEQNFSLFAYSLFDKSNWNKWEIDNNRINIALFHGTVSGARTDLNYYLDGDVTINEFSRYDYTFLGDIHKHQYLDQESRIGYCGSLVQQNYGEDIEKGFLIWDIQSKDEFTSKFIAIDPVHPYFTFVIEDINNTSISDYSFIPKSSRIRLKFTKDFDARTIDNLAKTFKHELCAEEVITITDVGDSRHALVLESKALTLDDLSDENIQEQLIKNYLSSNLPNEEIIKTIFEINKRHNKKIVSDVNIRNINWKINKLNFSNTFSFKEDNTINFDKLKGIVGIFGPNGIGKSSIVDVILYGIFNSNSKGIVKNLDIINTRKRTCSVKLDVSVNNTQYIVDRITTKLIAGTRSTDTKEHGRTDLDFYKIEDGETYSLNGLQRSDTEKNIRNIFGTIDDFLTTCVAAQGDMNHFVSQGSARRKEIVGKFLDLELFDKKYKLAKEEAAELKGKLKSLASEDFDKSIQNDRDNEKIINQLLSDLRKEKLNLKQLLSVDIDKLAKLNTSYESIKFVDDYKDLCHELIALEEKHNTLKDELIVLQKKEKDLRTAIENKELTSLEKEINDIQEQITNVVKSLQNINTLQIKKEKESINHEQFERSISLLSDIPCGDKFPNCKFIKNSFESKEKIKVCENEIKNLSREIESLNKKLLLEQKENLSSKKSELELCKITLNKRIQDLEYTELLIKNKILEIKNVTDQIKNTVTKKTQLESLNVHDLDTETIKNNIAKIDIDIKKLETDIRLNEEAQLKASKQLGIIQNNIKTLVNGQKTFKIISDTYYAYELYMKAISRNGIPQAIIRNKLSFINSEIDKLLRNIVKFKVELVDVDDKLEIYIDYKDGRARIIETTGGAEKAFASLAIRVALTRISTLPKPNIFIVDESFGTYDEMNRLNVSKMLQLLKQYFSTVLIVTHIDEIKDCVDYILTIDRDQDKFSYLS